MPTTEENERNFESMGLARVRVLVSTSALPDHMMNDAIQWVARGEEEERHRELTFETEQKQAALEQRQIARKTLIAAWIAAGASFVGIIVACLAWLFPRT